MPHASPAPLSVKTPNQPETRHAPRLVDGLWIVGVLLTGNVVGTALVFLWVRFSGTPLARLGFVRPKRVVRTVVLSILGGVALKLVVKAVILPAIGFDSINPVYRYVSGNASAMLQMLFLVIIGGGIGEETIYRGFLFDRLRGLGGARLGQLLRIIGTSAVFAAAHYADQGLPGVAQASITGLTMGTVYVLSGNIWAPMIVHATYDVAAIVMIYFDLESKVGHALFR